MASGASGGMPMIDHAQLPQISNILSNMGINPGKHGRNECPIHQGENRQAFSYDDDKGVWYCFRCGFGGDAIDLVKRAMDTDFKGAMRWLGLEPGVVEPPDPVIIRQRRVRQGLRSWAHKLQRRLRDEFYYRSKIEYHAKRRLQCDPEDRIGWELLSVAYAGIPLEELERQLDLLIGTEEMQLEIFKQERRAA
jgi:hypothetical protein